MSAAPTQPEQENGQKTTPAPSRNRWQRFVDWLAGGPPDPEKIEAARRKYPKWYRRYALSLIWLTCICVGFLPPLIVSRLLNAEPDWARMQTVKVRIVQTREHDPHFDMQLPDGRVQAMEWPETINFFGGRTRYHLWDKEQRLALVGCQATAQIALVRGTLTERYRVWSLSCPATGFEVGVKQTEQRLQRSLRITQPIDWVGAAFLLFMLIRDFLRERRGVE